MTAQRIIAVKGIEARLDALEAAARADRELSERYDRLLSMHWLLNERLSNVESRLGMEQPAPRETGLVEVKRAAGRLQCSVSQVRKLINANKLAHRRIGLHVFVLESALPLRAPMAAKTL